MVQNLVLNNSSHAFSYHDDAIRVQLDQTKVIGNPGSDAAINANLRSQLETGTLTSAGQGIHVDKAA